MMKQGVAVETLYDVRTTRRKVGSNVCECQRRRSGRHESIDWELNFEAFLIEVCITTLTSLNDFSIFHFSILDGRSRMTGRRTTLLNSVIRYLPSGADKYCSHPSFISVMTLIDLYHQLEVEKRRASLALDCSKVVIPHAAETPTEKYANAFDVHHCSLVFCVESAEQIRSAFPSIPLHWNWKIFDAQLRSFRKSIGYCLEVVIHVYPCAGLKKKSGKLFEC